MGLEQDVRAINDFNDMKEVMIKIAQAIESIEFDIDKIEDRHDKVED